MTARRGVFQSEEKMSLSSLEIEMRWSGKEPGSPRGMVVTSLRVLRSRTEMELEETLVV